MLVQRIEITLTGPDEYPEDGLEKWTAEERIVRYAFRDSIRIALRELARQLPEGYEIEIAGDI